VIRCEGGAGGQSLSHSATHSLTHSLTQVLRLRPGDRRGLLGPCCCEGEDEGEDEDEDEEGRQGEEAGARRSSPPRHRYSGGVRE
jgi:hypothetical protein